MKLYSDFPAQRTRQIVADLIAIAIVIASIVLGMTVYACVTGFAALGAGLQSAGNDFRTTMTDAADALGSVPLVGNGVRAPFDQASDAGAALASAGEDQQALVAQLALILGLVVALLPTVMVMRVWVVRRTRFARRASEARKLAAAPGGIDLLALRAMSGAPSAAVLAAHPDPAGAWRRGDTAAVAALARLELAASGIRYP